MPDSHEEVLIAILAVMALFLILAGIILVFLFLYRRRRTTQQRELERLAQQFKEQTLKAQLEIQEQTFQEISQEIHDNVGQILSLAKIQVNIITERRQLDDEILQAIKDNIGKAMTDLRDLAGSMNGERIRTTPIHEPLTIELDRINRSGILQCTLIVQGRQQDLEPGKKLILFRIIQECIQNCIKHARATQLFITVNYLQADLCVEVSDDGKGFDVAFVKSEGKGLGLINIQNRIRITGGNYEIYSRPSLGTRIKLTIPYA